ncbi:hypothetical protein AB3S75_023464 [Citrus x aurantiifolia]
MSSSKFFGLNTCKLARNRRPVVLKMMLLHFKEMREMAVGSTKIELNQRFGVAEYVAALEPLDRVQYNQNNGLGTTSTIQYPHTTRINGQQDMSHTSCGPIKRGSKSGQIRVELIH